MPEGYEIKPGTVAQVRITEEPIFVLAIKELAPYHQLRGVLGGKVAVVRRANVTEKGSITHSIEEFFLEELESKEANMTRKAEEVAELRAKYEAAQKSKTPQLQLPLSN